jgi:hypothetical protein
MTGARDEIGGWRLPAVQTEKIVAEAAAQLLGDRTAIAAAMEQAGLGADSIPITLDAARRYQQRLRTDAESAVALTIVKRIELKPEALSLTLSLAALISATSADGDEPMLKRDIPVRIKRRGIELRLVIANGTGSSAKADATLVKELARAYRCGDALVTGRVQSIAELAARENVGQPYVRRLLTLAFLAPEIIEAVLTGNQPADLTAS